MILFVFIFNIHVRTVHTMDEFCHTVNCPLSDLYTKKMLCMHIHVPTYVHMYTHLSDPSSNSSSEKYSSSSSSSPSRMQCKNGMLTLYNYYVFPALPEHTAENSCIVYDCREGRGVIIGNTQSVSIPFLFLFFFHLSSLYPIKIFAKCFYLLVINCTFLLTLILPATTEVFPFSKQVRHHWKRLRHFVVGAQ